MKKDMTVEEALDALMMAVVSENDMELCTKYSRAFNIVMHKCEMYWCDEQDRFKSIHNEGH